MRRRVLRIVVIALSVSLVLTGSAAAVVYWQAESIVGEFHAGAKRQVVDAARPELDVAPRRTSEPPSQSSPKARTILLLGSDRRYGDATRNSDTILLLRLDPARHRAALLSVPRDLYVEIPGHGHRRVNAAYGLGGPALVIRTLREVLGVRINHFFDMNFSGFQRVVDAVGGIFVPVDQRYFNRNVGTLETNYASIDLLPGYQRLSGRQALALVRFRHTDSDSYRASRQQLFLLATAQQALGTRVYDVVRVRRLLRAFAKATTSDVDGLRELWALVGAAREAAAGHVRRYTLPARSLQLYGADYVEASPTQIRTSVRVWMGDAPQRAPQPVRRTTSRAQAQVQLRSDAGAAHGLLAATRQWVPCTPTALPSGFFWPGTDAARAYRLAGHPAAALYATRGSGRSALWMWTTWQHPPNLDQPAMTVTRGGREYELTVVAGRVHAVAWRIGEWRVWITNTLRDELSGRTLLKLAETCRSARSQQSGVATPPRPPTVWKPIPMSVVRLNETAAYSARHYGLRTWRLSRPRVIVEHYTVSNSFASTWSAFASDAPDPELNEKPGVCAHFVVDRDGTIYQLVRLGVRCRHTVGLNWTAIGVEHVGTSDAEILGNARQLAASVKLSLWLMSRYGIELGDVIGHAESLQSPYHRERYRAWRCQTHGDFARASMDRYRARLSAAAAAAGVPVGRRVHRVRSGCP